MDTNQELLTRLNDEEARVYIGGVVFVSILMVLGVVGNLHVLLVYLFYMKSSNHRVFILVLAVLDFSTCIIGMPFILVDLRHPLTFQSTGACKILRFINYFVAMSSFFLMLVIAIERYRKICVPFGWQIGRNTAKALCLLVMVVSCCLSWPAPVLYGRSSIHIPEHNVTGTRCYEEDKFKGTKYMAHFNVVLILVFLIVFITLLVLYSLIWRVIMKHTPLQKAVGEGDSSVTETTETREKRQLASHSNSSKQPIIDCSDDKYAVTSSEQSEFPGNANLTFNKPSPKKSIVDKEIMVSLDENSGSSQDEAEKSSEQVGEESSSSRQKGKKPPSANSTKAGKKLDAASRTTLIFLLIAVLLCVSYIPHLVLKIVTFLNKDFVPNMSFTGKVMYNTFIWCFFINNVANPFVYGFCDHQFLNNAKKMYKKLFSMVKR